MRLVTLLLILSASFTIHAGDLEDVTPFPNCQALFGAGSKHVNLLYSGYVRVSSGNELYLRVESPGWARPKRWTLMIHGMMSNHRVFDEVSQGLLDEGVGVVRLDLRGFFRSLAREAQLARERGVELRAPNTIHFSEYVSDIMDVIAWLDGTFHIQGLEIAGHSMGGGLVAAVVANQQARALLRPQAVLLAPYVYRLEYYFAERLAFGTMPVANPLFVLERMTPELLRNETEKLLDRMITEPQLRLVFGTMFDDMVRSGEADYDNEPLDQMRSLQVDYGIAALKGMRSLDSSFLVATVPADFKVNMMVGAWDNVVDRGLAMKLGTLIISRGGQLVEVDAGHMLPKDMPNSVISFLLESQK